MSLREERCLGGTSLVERADFFTVPCSILEAGDGQKLAGRTRFELGSRWPKHLRADAKASCTRCTFTVRIVRGEARAVILFVRFRGACLCSDSSAWGVGLFLHTGCLAVHTSSSTSRVRPLKDAISLGGGWGGRRAAPLFANNYFCNVQTHPILRFKH